jgi:hypothetical protein
MLLPSIRVLLQRLLPQAFHRSNCKCGCDERMRARRDESAAPAEENLDCAPVLVPMQLAFVINEEFSDR